MVAKIILNPYAGRWKALERRNDIEASLRTNGVEYEIVLTERPGHGIQLAKEAVQRGFAPIISAGGDGSINEVINGMILGSSQQPVPALGVIPLGSANDLVDNLGLPKNLEKAIAVIKSGITRDIDVCQVNHRYFANNAAIGLEPYITLIQQRIHRLKGVLRYLAATIRGILDNPQWVMDIEWDGGEYSGPVTLVTVGNSPRTGGLFYMTPHAIPDDGLLTFVYGYMATRFQIFTLLPRTMKPDVGSYVEHPSIHEIDTKWLKVSSHQPTPAHADGEIFDTGVTTLEYKIYPKYIKILTGGNQRMPVRSTTKIG